MVYSLDSAWQKLKRAERHVDELRTAVAEAQRGDDPITIGREYLPDERTIVYKIERA